MLQLIILMIPVIICLIKSITVLVAIQLIRQSKKLTSADVREIVKMVREFLRKQE